MSWELQLLRLSEPTDICLPNAGYCEDDNVATLLLALHKVKPVARDCKIGKFIGQLGWAGSCSVVSVQCRC